MASFDVDILQGHSVPAKHTAAWNELWSRSGRASPTARAEPTAAWLAHFAAGAACETIVVRDRSRWLALLPIVSSRWGKLIPVGGLPRNEWCEAGDLILDPNCDVMEVSRILWNRLADRPWPIYRFSFVQAEHPGWQALLRAGTDGGICEDRRRMFDVSVLPCRPPWDDRWASLSKNFRKNLRRAEKRLRAHGRLDFRLNAPQSREENEHWLATALALEDSGWKGQCGSSVIRQSGLKGFVRSLTNALTTSGHVAYAWLKLDGKPVAFELLWRDQRMVRCFKVGYDERFSREQPGNVLLWYVLRHFTEHTDVEAYDCVGPTTPGLSRWAGWTRPVLRITTAPRRALSGKLITLYRSLWKPSEPRVDHARLPGRQVHA